MPHSSGGGSSGGGFHGGSSSGNSNHISTHYYPGARRFRRHYTDGRTDDYIYARSKPGKTGISTLVIIAIMGAIFIMATGFSAFSDAPKFIVPKYRDDPAVHDVANVMTEEEENELQAQIRIYNQTTGICPVIYTTYDEEWNREYENLEKFTYDKYVSNFSDEQHFVIVYSIPVNDAVFTPGSVVTSKEFKWEAVQGDETDPIITESAFRRFGKVIQKDLEAGKGPGTAFIDGFETANVNAENMLNPTSPSRIFKLFTGSIPLLITLGFFIPVFILMLKTYKKDKAMTYEEVPLDVEPSPVPGLSTYTNADGGVVTVNKGPGYYEKSVNYDAAKGTAGKVVKAISLVVIIPFILVGIGTITGGIAILKAGNDRTGGIFMLGFGIVWTLISLSTLISLLSASARAKKKMEIPLTAEYPKAEYPDMKPVTPDEPKAAEQPEFDPQFFGSAKSDYESEDEDYKRMKRRGFE